MKIFYLGATKFSEEVLKHLIKNQIHVHTVFTTPQEFKISYSKEKVKNFYYSDLSTACSENGINLVSVDANNGQKLSDFSRYFEEQKPDLLLVMGWYYMVPKKIRDLTRLGAWGIHASLLPEYAGGAPLVWAMIKGETETGISLFRLDDGVDDGDIIAQEKFPIEDSDTIAEVYAKATEASKDILIRTLLSPDSITFKSQDKSKIKVFPQRSPEDGEIDLNLSSKDLYNFIRAQAPPYPGAFIRTKDGKKLIIESCRLE